MCVCVNSNYIDQDYDSYPDNHDHDHGHEHEHNEHGIVIPI